MSADYATNPLPPSTGAGVVLPPLRLLADGLPASERVCLKAILDVLASKLPRRWVVVEGADADLYVHARGARRSDVRAGVTALLVHEDEPQAKADELWAPVPLRVMAMLDLLNGANARLLQAQAPCDAEPAPARDVADQPAANDEKTLASSLARLLDGSVEHCLRVRVLGFGTLYVNQAARTYHTDFDGARTAEALEAKRFILTAISPDSSELAGNGLQAHPLDELLWPIGLATVRETRPVRAQRLRSWPDFAHLPHDPRHLQACALLSTTPMAAPELAAASGMGEAMTERFLHACQLCGLLETVADAPPAPLPEAGASSSSLGGLFDRLWRRLVK